MSNNQRGDGIRHVASFDDVAVSLNPAATVETGSFITKSANEGIRCHSTIEVGAVSFEPAIVPEGWEPRSEPQVRIIRSRRAEILGRIGGALWRGAAVAAVSAVCVQYGTLLVAVGSCLATVLLSLYSDTYWKSDS